MKTLTLTADIYSKELSKYFAEIKGVQTGNDRNIKIYTLSQSIFDLDEFSDVLQNIVLNKNPILRNSVNLFFDVKKIIFQNCWIRENLEYYFCHNDELNVDGYVNFALKDYSEKIDYILYGVIKRNLKNRDDF